MPAGDSVRAWFPEMLLTIQQEWKISLSWEECAALCRRMTNLREEIKRERGIKGMMKICKQCGGVHEMGPAPITIRSLLFALRKKELINDVGFKRLDSEWNRYRKKYRLDGYGKIAEPDGSPNGSPLESFKKVHHVLEAPAS